MARAERPHGWNRRSAGHFPGRHVLPLTPWGERVDFVIGPYQLPVRPVQSCRVERTVCSVLASRAVPATYRRCIRAKSAIRGKGAFAQWGSIVVSLAQVVAGGPSFLVAGSTARPARGLGRPGCGQSCRSGPGSPRARYCHLGQANPDLHTASLLLADPLYPISAATQNRSEALCLAQSKMWVMKDLQKRVGTRA